MKRLHLLLLPLLLGMLSVFSACEKLEVTLPEKEKSAQQEESGGQEEAEEQKGQDEDDEQDGGEGQGGGDDESEETGDETETDIDDASDLFGETDWAELKAKDPAAWKVVEYVESHGDDEKNPFLVKDFRDAIPAFFDIVAKMRASKVSAFESRPVGMSDVYVHGYIVGYVPKSSLSKTVFRAGSVETNIVLADSPTEKDYEKCIAVELPKSSKSNRETRETLNLKSHPENLGREVIILGDAKSYMGAMGLKNAKGCAFYEEE